MKIAYYLAAACMALASCSNDDVATESDIGNNDIPSGASDQKISLNVTSPQLDILTRGSGTVGGVGTDNVWKRQTVRVFMLDKGTLKPAALQYDESGRALDSIYYNMTMFTPTDSCKGTAFRTDGKVKYYPLSGQYDFWGYYSDDAADCDNVKNDGNEITLPIEIDGTQDILLGAPNRTNDLGKVTKITESDLYSAKAASYYVQPNIVFNHQLTRLQFYYRAGNTFASDQSEEISVNDLGNGVHSLDPIDSIRYWSLSPAERLNFKVRTGVYVDTVRVYSVTTGKLLIASVAGEQGVKWTKDSTYIYLKQKVNGKDTIITVLPPKVENDDDVGKALGEAILLPPAPSDTTVENYNKYHIELSMHQYIKGKEDWWIKEDPANRNYEYRDENLYYPARPNRSNGFTLDLSKNVKGSVQGYSFNVNLTIWGLEKIIVNAQLTPWEDGGHIDQVLE